ncbi:phage head closure protein [Segatella copri]|nr:phage head closure protein [Segatella copri]MDV3120789.1 phage head closure protein [Segatella copri]
MVFNYTKIFTIRYYHNIDEKDRILWKGKLYRILSVEPDRDKQSIIIRTELIND